MTTLESTWQRHAESVVTGDSRAVAGDFTPSGMATALQTDLSPAGRPAGFSIRAVGENQADITYVGEVTRTMRTTWQETRPGTWQIVDIVEVAR
jgi:hypothetical protein